MRGVRTFLAGVLALAAVWPGAVSAQPATKTEAPATAPLTAQDFATLPFVKGVQISPNGDWVAGLFGVKGQTGICMMNLFDKAAKNNCIPVPDKIEASYISWVNNDNFVVHIRAQTPIEGKLRYSARLIAVNRVTGKMTPLLKDLEGQSTDSVIWIARDGSPYVLIGAQGAIELRAEFWPSVYRVNVETGQQTRVMSGREGVMSWAADSTGQVRLGYSNDDDLHKSQLFYRDENGGGLHVIDQANTRDRETLVEPLSFIPGSNHALLVRNDKGTSTLVESDLDPIKDIKTLYIAPEGSRIEDVILGDDGLTLLGVELRGKQEKRVWLESELAQVQADLDAAMGTQRVKIVSFSRDRKRMLVQVDRPETPGALYFFDVDDGVLRRLAFINERLRSTPLSPRRLATYRARDGLEIEAVVTTPRGTSGKNLPVIVMPHGGPWSYDTVDYNYWAEFLAERGYLVIQPNFRGSTGYGEDFEKGGEGQLGLAMQDDLNDALAWAVDQGLADGKRACIMGGSYGGYAALWGAARDPDLWRCAISVAGISSLRRGVLEGDRQSLYRYSGRDSWLRMTPDFAAISPINAVDRIKAPILLVHGGRDVTVDDDQSMTMATKMRAGGKTVEFVQVPLADHYYTREADRLTLLNAIAAFLDKYNPAH